MRLHRALYAYAAAFAFGLKPSVNIIYALLAIIPVSLLFIALGLLCGSALGSKQVGGICGALVTNLTAWLSGVWFDLELVSGLKTIADFLPFVHAVKLEQGLLNGDFASLLPHALWVAGYAIVLCAACNGSFHKENERPVTRTHSVRKENRRFINRKREKPCGILLPHGFLTAADIFDKN